MAKKGNKGNKGNKGKKTQQKNAKNKGESITKKTGLFSLFSNYWQEKSPVFKFIAGFLACILIFYVFYYSPWFETNFKTPILAAQAVAGGFLLNLFGYSVTVVNDAISGAGASVKIAGGCDGLEATALYLAAILVFPLPFKFKWPGLLELYFKG